MGKLRFPVVDADGHVEEAGVDWRELLGVSALDNRADLSDAVR
jgi:hypothetical protein